MNRKQIGFSLIELLVVVAIIALLAAMALPVYSKYTIKSKINGVMSVVSSIIDQEQDYYSKNNSFGNAYQIGLSSSTVNYFLVDAANLTTWSPYLNAIYIDKFWNGQQASIGVAFNITNFVGYNSGAAGPPHLLTGTGNMLGFEMYVNAQRNGTYQTYCVYRTDEGMTAAIAAAYLPSTCQTAQNGEPGPQPT